MAEYEFTNEWFNLVAKGNWDQLLPWLKPSRILEIGSFEGRSTCYLIDTLSQERELEIHCIDTFEGGAENKPGGFAMADMSAVESRFKHNTNVALARAAHSVDFHVHKGFSESELPKLLANGMQGYFDFIYVDGSHQAPHVLLDAVLSLKLCRVGGVIGFDDYTWRDAPVPVADILCAPKLAIDAFTNIYSRSVAILPYVVSQVYVEKIAD